MITLTYKQISGLSLQVDIHPPAMANPPLCNSAESTIRAPAILFFHGGGLTVGNRKSWFPSWMHSTPPG